MKPKGDHVWINADPYGVVEQWTVKAKVEDVLSVQFTAKWEGTGTLSFLFFNDEGATWRNVDGS